MGLFKASGASKAAGLRRMAAEWLLRTWYLPCPPCRRFLSSMLALGSKFYVRGLKIDQSRALSKKRRLEVPVISIGNIVVGGTGKTPFTLWLARYLQDRGYVPAILSRGYGRSSTKVARVPSQGETSLQVPVFGDEPVLMARKAGSVPVWVGRKRWESGKAAVESSGANLLLLDDGFQHLALERDLDFVLMDSQNPFGNGSLLPLGPLREPLEHLERAGAFVLTRAENPSKTLKTKIMIQKRFPDKPVFSCRHRLAGFRVGLDGPKIALKSLKGQAAVAFAGIARPEDFFKSLRSLGIDLPVCFHFPDHHPYGIADFELILKRARAEKARFLITTEKDMVRLPERLQQAALCAELEMDFEEEQKAFCTYLEKVLAHGRARS